MRALAFLAVIVLFGALWGAVEGVWLLAPVLVRDHRIIPTTLTHWLALDTTLLVVSAGLGAVLAIFAAGVILGWPIVRRRPYRDAALAAGLALGSLLPLGYLGLTVLIEWKYFRRVPSFRDWRVAVGAAAYVVGSIALLTTYRRFVARPTDRAAMKLGWILAAVAVAGAIVLPFRSPPPTAPQANDGGAFGRAADTASTGPPLLLVGLDGANWDTIRPLLARGSLPTIGRLIATGAHGDVEALWPPYWSAAAWAAILTGYPQEETGVYADLTVHAPGLPLFDAPLNGNALLDPYILVEWYLLGRGIIHATHPPRSTLHRPPLWEVLSRAGVDAGVIRFDFTYPADPRTSVVISNFVGRDNWGLARAHTEPRAEDDGASIAPAAWHDELTAPYSDDVPFEDELLSAVLPGWRPPTSPSGALEMKMLRGALDMDHRTFIASERVLRLRPGLRFLGVYFSGFDEVCHAFWQYRFPEAYGDARPSAADVAEFGGVIDRYLESFDRRLARLLAVYPSPPNVILISDHGFVATLDHPLWRGWHGGVGVFIAAGPAFPRRADPLAVSYYDLVPTVADVLGLTVPKTMRGTSVVRR